MKKTVSYLLTLLLVTFCFAFRTPEAKAVDEAWVKVFYKDKFGDATDEYYLTNESQFKGIFNSDTVNDGELGANLMFEQDGTELLAYLTLFLNGTDQVKYGTSSGENYVVSVKRADGSQFDTSGYMIAGENRIQLKDAAALIGALRSPEGIVKIYVEDSVNKNNNYLFAVDCGNSDELFAQEIEKPYLEERYQQAVKLMNDEQLDEAVAIFKALQGYKDSDKKVEEIESYLTQEEIKSDTGVPLNIFAEWEISNKTADSIDLKIDVYVESYSIYTTATPDSLSVSANGQKVSLATPAIEIQMTQKSMETLLNTHTFQIDTEDIKDGRIPVEIQWSYRGTYAGVFIDDIECSGDISIVIPETLNTQPKQEIAREYVDRPLSELIEKIGEPLSAEYVTSCLIPGGQDGELHYEDFTVYTVKDADSETVMDVQN